MKAKSLWRMFSIFAIATGLSLCLFSCGNDDDKGNNKPTESKVAYAEINYVYELTGSMADFIVLTVEYVDETGAVKKEVVENGKFNKKIKTTKFPGKYSFTATCEPIDEFDISEESTFDLTTTKGLRAVSYSNEGGILSLTGGTFSGSKKGIKAQDLMRYIEGIEAYSSSVELGNDGRIKTNEEEK